MCEEPQAHFGKQATLMLCLHLYYQNMKEGSFQSDHIEVCYLKLVQILDDFSLTRF